MKPRATVLCILLGCLVLLIGAGYLLLSSRAALARGLDEVHHIEATLHNPAARRNPDPTLQSVSIDLQRADADFSSADHQLSILSPALERLSWLPDVGQEVAGAPSAARLAHQVTSGALPLVAGLAPVVRQLSARGQPHRVGVTVLVREIGASRQYFRRSCIQLNAARITRKQLNRYHAPTLRSVLASFDQQFPRLLTSCRALSTLPDMLGYKHAQTYLVAYQNQDELRATGGFIGSIAILNLRNGIAKERFRSPFLHDNLSILPPEPVASYNREAGWLFADSNWSPNFPTSAALERYFLNLNLHQKPNGVINMTPQAAADILGATGPIYSPEYHRWITSGNVARLADYYAHWTVHPGPLDYANFDTRRKQFIGIVANHILNRLQTLSVDRLLRLSDSISTAIAQRDILINFTNPAEQAVVEELNAAGSINRTRSDYLYVVDTNLSYNKINPYVHVYTTYNARIRPDRWLLANLTVRLTNQPAPPKIATYGLGPGAGTLGGPDDYADFLRVYVPAGAQLLDQSGWRQPWSPGSAYGKTMFCGYIIVRRGQTRTINLEYIIPPNIFSPSHGRQYHLTVQHQPGSHPDGFTVSVSADLHHSSHWSVSDPVVDWSASMPIPNRPFHPIPLPVQPKTIVAPGHWIEPHAYLHAPRPGG